MILAMNDKLSRLCDETELKNIYLTVLRVTKKLSKSTDRNAPQESEFTLLHNMVQLLDSCAESSNVASANLFNELKLLTAFFAGIPEKERLQRLHYFESSIEVICNYSIPILYKCNVKEIAKSIARELDGSLSEVVDQIEQIKLEVAKIKLYYYPKTDGLGFLRLFLGHLEELLTCQPDSIETIKGQIETLYSGFGLFVSFFKITKEKLGEVLWTHILHLAYQAEYLIDSYLALGTHSNNSISALSEISEQVNPIKTKVIMECLVGGHRELDVIWMPSLEGTNLAMSIFKDYSVVRHFDVRAWCTMSKKYENRELLLAVLTAVTGQAFHSFGTTQVSYCHSVRSLLIFHTKQHTNIIDHKISYGDVVLIKVFDPLMNSMPSYCPALIHLKYFAIRGKLTNGAISASIKSLHNLQILIVINDSYPKEGMKVPDTLFDMVNLRHVYIRPYASFIVDPNRFLKSSSSLENLQKLSKVCLSCGEENILKMLPNLRELNCIFLDYWVDSRDVNKFPEVNFLSQLTSLKVEYGGGDYDDRNRCELQLPRYIKKLSQSKFRLSSEDISEFGKLRYLESLKFYRCNIFNSTWNVNEGDFQTLKHLKCENLQFKEWNVPEEPFPCLEQLLLVFINLKSIPLSFGEIPFLRRMEVVNCSLSVGNSARVIEKMQREEIHNEELQVRIVDSSMKKVFRSFKQVIRAHNIQKVKMDNISKTNCAFGRKE